MIGKNLSKAETPVQGWSDKTSKAFAPSSVLNQFVFTQPTFMVLRIFF
jgi:hypothetical protein